MGWISDRKMRTGSGIGGMKGKKHKGPLRMITGFVDNGRKTDMFNPPRVRLECGHETDSWGQVKARCRTCGNSK